MNIFFTKQDKGLCTGVGRPARRLTRRGGAKTEREPKVIIHDPSRRVFWDWQFLCFGPGSVRSGQSE
jgi:hypothetical protein